MGNDYDDLFKDSKQYQNKFDFLFLSIIIGTLAFSVQTFEPKPDTKSIYLLIFTWAMLIFSFMAGFFRIERITLFLKVESEKIRYKQKQHIFNNALSGSVQIQLEQGKLMPSADIKENFQKIGKILNLSDKFLDTYNKHILIAYQIQKWSFLFAILCYSLFKVSNLMNLSLFTELTIVITSPVITFCIVKIYKKRLLKSDNNTG